MTDPTQTLLALAKDRSDPKVVANWVTAYLGKRSPDARRIALAALEAAFVRPAAPADARAVGLILSVVRKIQAAEK